MAINTLATATLFQTTLDKVAVQDAVTGWMEGNVEFGTGPNGQADHQGISPNIPVAYRQTGWMMPASTMSEEEARGYGFGIAKDKEGKVIGYYTKGQPARPFLYPAMADNVEEIIDIYKKYVKEKAGEV